MRSDIDPSQLRGDRFCALREIEGLTQTELATRLGVSQGFISKVMNLERPVPFELAVNAAVAFALPMSFFAAPHTPGNDAVATFRRDSKATIAQERRIVRLFREALRAWWQVSDATDYRELDLPSMDTHRGDPETAAREVRELDGLEPVAPIRNVTRLLERRGVGVIHQVDPKAPLSREAGRHHDGISAPASVGTRPVVALVGPMPGGAARLTLAHELGHLLFDEDLPERLGSSRSPEEKRAFEFAGALLLPQEVIRERIDEKTTLMNYLPLKAKYGISVGAIIIRARTLGLISPSRARTLQIQLSSLGWRKDEPIEIPQEKPTLFLQAAQRLWPTSTIAQASFELGLRPEWLHTWLSISDEDPLGQEETTVVDLELRRSARRRATGAA